MLEERLQINSDIKTRPRDLNYSVTDVNIINLFCDEYREERKAIYENETAENEQLHTSIFVDEMADSWNELLAVPDEMFTSVDYWREYTHDEQSYILIMPLVIVFLVFVVSYGIFKTRKIKERRSDEAFYKEIYK